MKGLVCFFGLGVTLAGLLLTSGLAKAQDTNFHIPLNGPALKQGVLEKPNRAAAKVGSFDEAGKIILDAPLVLDDALIQSEGLGHCFMDATGGSLRVTSSV